MRLQEVEQLRAENAKLTTRCQEAEQKVRGKHTAPPPLPRPPVPHTPTPERGLRPVQAVTALHERDEFREKAGKLEAKIHRLERELASASTASASSAAAAGPSSADAAVSAPPPEAPPAPGLLMPSGAGDGCVTGRGGRLEGSHACIAATERTPPQSHTRARA